MAQYLNMYKIDLNSGTAPVVNLKQIYYADIKANRVGVLAYLNGAPATLAGTCSGSAILADGSTVPMTGVVSGNQAYIDLVSSCYSVEGIIKVFVKLTTGGVTTTLLAAVGTVKLTETGTVIDPGTIIPSVSALITAIDEAVDSIPADYSALLASIAPNFSSSASYVIGDYVWYSGTLYRFTSAHSGSWSNSDAVQATVAEGLNTGAVRYDMQQSLSGGQKVQARANIKAAAIDDTDFSGNADGFLIAY